MIKNTYEEFHHVVISDSLIDLIINLSNKYITDRKQPDKAIDILDEVCAHVSLKENKKIKEYNELNKNVKLVITNKKKAIFNNDYKLATAYKMEENKLMNKINRIELDLCNKNNNHHITKKDIINIVSIRSNVPIYTMSSKDIKDSNSFSNKLNKKVIGQSNAIEELSKIYKQIRLGFKDDKCYSIMFAGPSGVGKTMLAKLFGKNITKNIIKIDMSEYSEAHSISKLIGSPSGYVGYNDSKNILDKIKDHPFSVLILDEFDKADITVINLFYQALDDGVITDAKGDTINFKNTIIIMTTNTGFEKNDIGFNTTNNDIKIKELFGIPLVNRIDKIVMFNYLDLKSIKKIVKDKINKLKKKYKDIKISISNIVMDEIINKSNYNEFGARKIDKIIKTYIEDIIINSMIENKKDVNITSIKMHS